MQAWPDDVEIIHRETTDIRLPLDVALAEQSGREAVYAAFEAELTDGPPTGFGPERNGEGQVVVSFLTHTLHATKGRRAP